MRMTFNILKDNEQEPKNYCRLLLDALVSDPNHAFDEYIQLTIDDVRSGTGSNASIKNDQFVKSTRLKCNTMSN